VFSALDLPPVCRKHARMSFGSWDTVVNAVLLILWLRIWTEEDRAFVFNPYMAPMARASESVIIFLRPVFGALPPRLVAAAAVAFLLVFRGFTISLSSPGMVRLGFELKAPGGGVWNCVAFSALSFGVFIFGFWGICLLYLRPFSSRAHVSHTQDAMRFLGRPFTDLPMAARPFALLAFGILLAYLLNISGRTIPGFPQAIADSVHGRPPSLSVPALAVSALAGIADLLPAIRSLTVVLIIGSLVALFAGSSAISFFCRDWIDFFLGPARRFPIRIGMFDLTPLIFIILLNVIHNLLLRVLINAYTGILS
jgi:uncharacterized protein YggT (Ycf19 family)